MADSRASIVRVVTATGHGTGFFVSGLDGEPLVATAFHVVASGSPVTIERQVDLGRGTTHRVAYPDTEVVAFDHEADLALLRIKHLPPATFAPLPLGTPQKDEEITSWGFPGSSFVGTLDLTRKDGRLSNLVSLDATDLTTGRTLRENAVPGLIVSTALEPGFSGGPTTNARGEVVGVNVMKDGRHDAQNACVSVSALRGLMARIVAPHMPSPEEVERLLLEVQANYLRLGGLERMAASELDVVSPAELPRVRELVADLTRIEAAGHGGEVALLELGRLPGPLLSNYAAPIVQSALKECRQRTKNLRDYLARLDRTADAPSVKRCEELAVRPLIADLVASTLRWGGKEREVSVSKVTEIDAERLIYRANVSFGAETAIVPIELGWSYGRLALRLFDAHGFLVAGNAGEAPPIDRMRGRWTAEHDAPRVGQADDGVEYVESLQIGDVQAGEVTIVHRVSTTRRAAAGHRWDCSGTRELSFELTQKFVGTFDGESIVAKRAGDATSDLRPECARLATYQADMAARFKMIDGALVMLRTSTPRDWPESRSFRRATP